MNREMLPLQINNLRIFRFMVPMHALWDWRLSMNLIKDSLKPRHQAAKKK